MICSQLNKGERNLLRSSTNIGKGRMKNINVYACYCQAISSIDWTLHTIIHGRTNNICRVCRVKPLIEFLYEKNVKDKLKSKAIFQIHRFLVISIRLWLPKFLLNQPAIILVIKKTLGKVIGQTQDRSHLSYLWTSSSSKYSTPESLRISSVE